MTYLLDADWIISYLNGRRQAVELIEQLADDELAVSIIVVGEIYEGLLIGPRSDERRASFELFLRSVEVLSPDDAVAHRYAEIRAQLRSQGQLLPDNDLWIAATALAYDLELVSRDHHFERIPQLKRYQPA
jgi:tRNA(fMet)-specific endonuclease VapC